MYEPFLVQGEEPTETNPDGWSIIERMKIYDEEKFDYEVTKVSFKK